MRGDLTDSSQDNLKVIGLPSVLLRVIFRDFWQQTNLTH
jgi:hypothetical protein